MRLPRYTVVGNPQHIIHRGYRRLPVFAGKEDCQYYLMCLHQAGVRYDVAIHAYVLMFNHVHLLATPNRRQGISRMMQSVSGRYVKRLNRRGVDRRPLWDGRYKSTLVDPHAYLFLCMRYVELNPVRAGVADDPGGYPWSSYGRNALGRGDDILCRHERYLALGTTAADRCRRYRGQFEQEIPAAELRRIRVATNSGWALGDERFVARMATRVNRRLRPLPRGGSRPPHAVSGLSARDDLSLE